MGWGAFVRSVETYWHWTRSGAQLTPIARATRALIQLDGCGLPLANWAAAQALEKSRGRELTPDEWLLRMRVEIQEAAAAEEESRSVAND